MIFLATKADQIVDTDIENTRHLLAEMTKDIARKASLAGINTKTEAISAIRCGKTKRLGKETVINGDAELDGLIKHVDVSHPCIPGYIPSPAEFDELFCFKSPRFIPPKLPNNQKCFPHIRMDKIIDDLLGEKCL